MLKARPCPLYLVDVRSFMRPCTIARLTGSLVLMSYVGVAFIGACATGDSNDAPTTGDGSAVNVSGSTGQSANSGNSGSAGASGSVAGSGNVGTSGASAGSGS